MDRNKKIANSFVRTTVVPRKGDVDRNALVGTPDTWTEVVPRKGDVDRNGSGADVAGAAAPSSPARGMWIEISHTGKRRRAKMSSPARGMWIEILLQRNGLFEGRVVPRKGDVDRNVAILYAV